MALAKKESEEYLTREKLRIHDAVVKMKNSCVLAQGPVRVVTFNGHHGDEEYHKSNFIMAAAILVRMSNSRNIYLHDQQ